MVRTAIERKWDFGAKGRRIMSCVCWSSEEVEEPRFHRDDSFEFC
jgi:hypothetical protein